MKRSLRKLSIDRGIDKGILRNNQIMLIPYFPFIPTTGLGLPKTRVHFCRVSRSGCNIEQELITHVENSTSESERCGANICCISMLYLYICSMLGADVATAAVLISMGAVLGRTTPLQLVVMGILEIILYAVNLHLCTAQMQVRFLKSK